MSFRRIYDALTKGPMIEEAYGKVEGMHDLSRENFEAAMDCLFGGEEKACARKVVAEDKRLNRMEIEIRKEVFQYLAISSAPNVNASLILVSTVIDYERIGDICKNIAQLPQLFPLKLEEDYYSKQMNVSKKKILTIFDLTITAVKEGELEKAKKAMRLHDEIKDIHDEMIKRLNREKDFTVRQGMFYALLGYYIRRINGHLGNICSTAITSFPEMGFKERDE